MRRVYYPFTPATNKRFKVKSPAFLIVHTIRQSEFVIAGLLTENGLTEYSESDNLALVLAGLKHNTWVITYDIENIVSLYESLMKHFDKITGVAKDNRVLTLMRRGPDKEIIKLTIIDSFVYFARSFPNVIKTILNKPFPDDDLELQVKYLMMVWDNFTQLLGAEFGIYPSATPGATAIKLYKRFLPVKINARGLRMNRLLRRAIKPPALHWKSGVYDNAYLYDLNAAYVHIMKVFKFPMELRAFANKPPPAGRWIALVNIDYKTTCEFSPLSVFIPEDGINVNPTEVKSHRTTLTYIDALTLAACGELKINEFIEGVCWDESQEVNLFGPWAEKIESLSLASPANKLMLKIISRSLHSKFSQKRIYKTMELVKTDYKGFCRFIKQGRAKDVFITPNNEFIVTVQYNRLASFKAFDRPDYEALIMAGARFVMYSAINADTVYCHTDSIISTVPRDDLFQGSGFGAWKLTDTGRAWIAGLGVYTIGDKTSTSGFNVPLWEAIQAIKSAAAGRAAPVNSTAAPGIFKQTSNQGAQIVNKHNYPRAILRGNIAYVTQSPTRKVYTTKTRRLLSAPPVDNPLISSIIKPEASHNEPTE